MDTKPCHEPLLRACHLVGGQAALARLLGVAPSTVNQWVTLVRPIPFERCLGIEAAVAAQVVCEELLPSFNWAALRKRGRARKRRGVAVSELAALDPAHA
ncbi:Cro/Cl family transcriptional regulator [Achromobacter marplatensis]|uniref:helix-turn-helix domain-containing protein n=1 Tax=Achromobacter marplatensis TaxID=470868 RepID=UPI000B51A854|nr:helix-turn-helix domain-containing protein [Achromobacter marplatensis]OWT67736.1 Cro/Cl family transcriptional regulator [Achromobacter marplatensis]